MIDIRIDVSNAVAGFSAEEKEKVRDSLELCHKQLTGRTGKGNDFLGWMDLPSAEVKDEMEDMLKDAARIRAKSEAFVVVGIGGSYLGARAVIEALGPYFPVAGTSAEAPEVIYAGHQLDQGYMAELLAYLDRKDYSMAVISKSGTTTEPAIAFRLLKKHMENKYGKREASGRIVAITDIKKGALKKMSEQEGYKTYVIPDDVGGRYSVLTPVGLLPVAVAGFDIDLLMDGALKMENELKSVEKLSANPAIEYAAARNLLYSNGKKTEVLVNYLPRLYYFTEWWKQLFGESEGKEHLGIWPSGAGFTTDLHSLGQYIQEGERNLFETVLSVEKTFPDCIIPPDNANLDGLNYLSGKNIHEVNRVAEKATTLAHEEGGVPVININIPLVNESVIGQLIYFFEFSCALSGYQLGINPFDQPGVEAYKKNMFALLGKPGFEDLAKKLREKM